MKKRIVALVAAAIAALGVITVAQAHDTINVADKAYVAKDGTVWEESNDVDGLQKEATDQDGDGSAETPADNQLL